MDTDSAPRPRRVLVVEDEFLIALDIQTLLEDLGCEVLGPCPSVAKALALLETELPDLAILDVNLGRERSTPVAEALRDRSVPYGLATGYDAAQLPEPALRDAPRIRKPISPSSLRDLLDQIG